MIFGAGRFLNGAIISLKTAEDSEDDAFDDLMAHVEKNLNTVVPEHSRLIKPLILLSRPDKPFVYTDKGTVRRNATLELYDEEIEDAYRVFERGASNGKSLRDSSYFEDGESINKFLVKAVALVLGHAVDINDDFFNSGMDSLLAARLCYEVNSALPNTDGPHRLSTQAIYNAPTIARLSATIQSLRQHDSAKINGTELSTGGVGRGSIEDEIERLISQYSSNLSLFDLRSNGNISTKKGLILAVTGTTGSLGSTFLSVLLDCPEISKIYSLNRINEDLTIMERHMRAFAEKGLGVDGLRSAHVSERLVFVDFDFQKERLGIRPEIYEEVCSTHH